MTLVAGRRAMTLCFVALAAGCCGCSTYYETPDACFAAAKTAMTNKDPVTFCRCLTEESQQTVAGTMVVVGSLTKMVSGMAAMGGGEEAKQAKEMVADITAIMDKHGVTDEALKKTAQSAGPPQSAEALRSIADLVDDKPIFIAEMIGALSKAPKSASFVERISEQYAGDLKDVKIDGDNATAIVSGSSAQQTVEFRKTEGGWRIHIDPAKLNGAGPPV